MLVTRVGMVTALAVAVAALSASVSVTAVSAEPSADRTPATIDFTYSCATGFVGGVRSIELRSHAGARERGRSEWRALAYAVVASGGVAKTPFVDAPPENSVAWISAGKPAPETTVDDTWLSFTVRAGGTIGVNKTVCTFVRKRLPLSARSLVGGPVGPLVSIYDCEVPKRVLIRVQADVDGATALRVRGELFRVASVPARLARFTVAKPSGDVVAFAEVTERGKARLFRAEGCSTS